MDKLKNETVPEGCKNLEQLLEKNPKDEVYCVGNKASSEIYFFYFDCVVVSDVLASGGLKPGADLEEKLTDFRKQQAPKAQGSRGDRGHASPGIIFFRVIHKKSDRFP